MRISEMNSIIKVGFRFISNPKYFLGSKLHCSSNGSGVREMAVIAKIPRRLKETPTIED